MKILVKTFVWREKKYPVRISAVFFVFDENVLQFVFLREKKIRLFQPEAICEPRATLLVFSLLIWHEGRAGLGLGAGGLGLGAWGLGLVAWGLGLEAWGLGHGA